jgi:xylulokinase
MFLGIDLGTSSLKALLIDGQDRIHAQASSLLQVASPRPSWSEQDPHAWWDACLRSVLALPANLRRQVRGIGLSGQMHGAVLLDAQDAVLRPAILWNDGRSAAECTELERREPRVREITGNLPMAGFTAPKLMWVHRHEPEVFRATRTVLLPKDYLRLRLTGAKSSCPISTVSARPITTPSPGECSSA